MTGLLPQFSENPTDDEIIQARVFLEPILPQEGEGASGENTALAEALVGFRQAEAKEDVPMLKAFLEAFPTSRWVPSLQVNLGLLRYEQGYLSEAVALLAAAWEGTRHLVSYAAKAVADRAIGDLLVLKARLGHVAEIERLLEELGSRDVVGTVLAKVEAAKDGLWRMKNTPEVAFKCGPFALNAILYRNEKAQGRHDVLEAAVSTAEGTNLRQVRDWSVDVGLDYQIARRSPGAAVIVPSVMHWKLDHFAALTREEGGRYLVQDATFEGYEIFVSPKVLDAETDGYFLVPQGALPEGWVTVSDEEAETVWGKGGAAGSDEDKSKDDPKDCKEPPEGMARSSSFLMQARLNISDTPLFYVPPIGPRMDFSVNYNYGEIGQPTTFTFPNLGANWSFNWVSYLTVDSSRNVSIRLRGGGLENFNWSQADNVTNSYAPNLMSQAVLVLTQAGVYERRLPDGSVEVYDKADGTSRIFLTKVIDPQGNAATITYDGNFRVTGIVDALGQTSTVTYASASSGTAGFYKITRVTDPFGRFAAFTYDGAVANLLQITDAEGMASSFTYTTGSFIDSLTTPYGTTLFETYTATPVNLPPPGDGSGRGLRTTYPDGSQTVVESWLGHTMSTFRWDRRAMWLYPEDYLNGDYTHCETIHWLMKAGANIMSPVPASIKKPLENAVTYTYPDQAPGIIAYTGSSNKPATITRVLDDASEQVYRYEYGPLGNVTKTVDPEGRTFLMKYAANNVDLLEVRQVRDGNYDLIGKWAYNDQHCPTLHIDGSGQRWSYTYNSRGQVLTSTDPENNTTTNTYLTSGNAWGYLTEINGPLAGTNDKTTLTYDTYGRVRTRVDSVGYTLTYDYDALNRLTKTTYPDASYEQTIWSRLDPVMTRDRLGRWSQAAYDSMRKKIYDIDPLSRKTAYEWCFCGGIKKLTDGEGNVTLWHYDVQGRVVQKVYADESEENYAYENAISRLKSMTDALGQTKNYTYFKDNQLKQISYTNAVNPTSTVNLTYDEDYARITSVSNGWGTITHSYYPYITDPWGTPVTGAGLLHSVTNDVIPNSDIVHVYDTTGRLASRAIDGSNNTTEWTYDEMGRVTEIENVLGQFQYSYVDPSYGTNRLSVILYPNGQVTSFSWYNNLGDQRLQQIKHETSTATVLSQFDYEYLADGSISKWTQTLSDGIPVEHRQEYDFANQLIGSVSRNASTSAIIDQHYYHYDKVGNRTTEQFNTAARQGVFNDLNQLTALAPGGAVRVKGTLDKAGRVTVNSSPAKMGSAKSFEGDPILAEGSNLVTVQAIDGASNTRTQVYEVDVDAMPSRSFTYDANGNTLSDGERTYEWDAENRLLAIGYDDGRRTEFSYDGLGRRVKIEEKDEGVVTSSRLYLWNNKELVDERDVHGVVTKRFFPQGEEIGGLTYYGCKDHLESVFQLTDDTEVMKTEYGYDPFGRVISFSGSPAASFQYAGYFCHEFSDLYLTLFRVSDPNNGRWLSRDPLSHAEMLEGANLYVYVSNNPINLSDPMGLIAGGRGDPSKPPKGGPGSAKLSHLAGAASGICRMAALLPTPASPFLAATSAVFAGVAGISYFAGW